MKAPTSLDKGVSPAQFGRSSCPSWKTVISPPVLLDTSDDAALTTTESRLLDIPFILASDPIAEKTAERFCAGAHSAIGVFERERESTDCDRAPGVPAMCILESLKGLLYCDTWMENEHCYLPGLQDATCQ